MHHECNVIDLPAFYGRLNVGRKGGGIMSELAKWMVSEPSEYLNWLLDDNRTRGEHARGASPNNEPRK